jgi:hypothetical protein
MNRRYPITLRRMPRQIVVAKALCRRCATLSCSMHLGTRGGYEKRRHIGEPPMPPH